MKRYLSHKEVEAALIIAAAPAPTTGGMMLELEVAEGEVSLFPVSREWIEAKVKEGMNVVGGWYVVYAGGYFSWSPADAFAEGYKEIETDPKPAVCGGMDTHKTFAEALIAVYAGKRVERSGWNGKGMHIERQTPDENSKMTHPYLFMVIPECKEGTRSLPWQPAQVDLFATDWIILD